MNALEKLECLQADLYDFEEEIRSEGEDIIRDAAKEVFDSVEGLTKFFCRGYTPRPKNGEYRRHSSEIYLGNLSYSWCECDKNYRLSDDGGVEQEPDFFGVDFDCIDDQPTFNSAEECPKVEYANSGVVDRCLANRKVEDMICLCEFVYVTNYKVFFTKRDDGSVDVVHEDCDYGY